jgi:hypothetical protein
MISYFFLGILIGAVGIGLPTLRTLEVIKGHCLTVFLYSILASCAMFSFTVLVAGTNWPFMIGNVIGSAVSVTWIAYNEKKKLEEIE